MRLYRIVLFACIIAIVVPIVSLFLQKALNPAITINWRGLLNWFLPAAAILILLFFFPRMNFQPLAILAGIIFIGLLSYIFVLFFQDGNSFHIVGFLIWLTPYLIGAGGILIAARYRERKLDSFMPNE